MNRSEPISRKPAGNVVPGSPGAPYRGRSGTDASKSATRPQRKLWPQAAQDAPRIGILHNPRSHGNRKAAAGQIESVADRANVECISPTTRNEIGQALLDFKRGGIDYLIVNGGDGTVRDMLSAGQRIFADGWPLLAVMPRGKTNALTEDLGVPRDWTLERAVDAIGTAPGKRRRPLKIERMDGSMQPVAGFILGAGAFTTGIRTAQDAHKLGAFGGLAVALTAIWGAAQMIFGTKRNRWRRGVEMTVALGPDRKPMPHSGHGEADRRSILVATSLHKMPMDLKVFGNARDGLKIAAIDRPLRKVWLSMPAILAGWEPDWLSESGFHRVEAASFELTLGDEFILDGEVFPPGAYRVSLGPELTFRTG
ncbi:diacylglycerol/lipid kinase family protein [Qipengyuania atrilutea]|uniref:NAD(+)/NADH kinase n=1 Tax=Qipengyuania atrilutea TaxID=2744473 RepID=A0A850H2Y0_9SPHN|nr:diacylglycerol kinase family protein [Actirhodobacter atriluteus]NVD44552.1 NAD(+)/NADH kinase [Actirhodobacter atriluteus]